jgi:hypothetical protein
MKDITVRSEGAYYLWEEGVCGNNIGIVWDKEYAELIEKALKFYKESHKESSEINE